TWNAPRAPPPESTRPRVRGPRRLLPRRIILPLLRDGSGRARVARRAAGSQERDLRHRALRGGGDRGRAGPGPLLAACETDLPQHVPPAPDRRAASRW